MSILLGKKGSAVMPSGTAIEPSSESTPTTGQVTAYGRIDSEKNRNQPTSVAQWLISDALDDALCRARRRPKLELKDDSKYNVFSDHHKGIRNGTDDFAPCKTTYLRALKYYYEQGYTLIVLGDAEELWEEKPGDVVRRYKEVLDHEALFHREQRYLKMYGNHDDDWKNPKKVEEYLHGFFPRSGGS